MNSSWTPQRVCRLIEQALEFCLAGRREVGNGFVWFGPEWHGEHVHWIRSHCEALTLVAAYVHCARQGTVSADPDILFQLTSDAEAALHAAAASHVSEGALRFPDSEPWGLGWQTALSAYYLTVAVFYLKPYLSPHTVNRVRAVVAAEADRFPGVTPPCGVLFDTKMEENSWDSALLSWAAFVFSDHPNASLWEKAGRWWAFSATTVVDDRFDFRLLEDDRTVAQWCTGPTLHPDFTCENHGTFHPNYQTAVPFGAPAAYLAHGKPVPSSISHHTLEVLGVLAYFTGPDAATLMVTGNDWPSFHGIHTAVPTLTKALSGAAKFSRMASAYLDRIEWFFSLSEDGHVFGSTLQTDVENQRYFFHTFNCSHLPLVLPALPLQETPEPDLTCARHFRYVQVICQRDELRMASVAWRTLYGHPLFVVLPLSDSTWAGWAPFTGVGRLTLRDGAELRSRVKTHEEHVEDHAFTTRGEILWVHPETLEPIASQTMEMISRRGEPVRLREKVMALKTIEVGRNQGLTMSLANDIHNRERRLILGDGRSHVVPALTGPQELEIGLEVTIDERVRYRCTRDMIYHSPGERLKEDNRYRSTHFERLFAPGRIGGFAVGEEIRSTELAIDVLR